MRDAVSSLTATVVIQVSNIASGIFLARYLQPDGRGELAAVMLWPTVIAAIGIFGLHEAIAFHAARRQHGSRAILWSGLLLGFLLSLALLPVGALVANGVFTAEEGQEVRDAAFLYLAFIPLTFAGQFLVALFQGSLRFAAWNFLRTSVHLFTLLFILLAHFIGEGGVYSFAAASLLANAAMIAVACVLYARADWHLPAPEAARKPWRDLASYGASVHVGAAIAIVADRLDQMIISLFLPAADLGLFVIALTLSRLPLVLASTLATVAFPKIASLPQHAGRVEVFGRYARVTFLLILPASLALAAMTPWLLPFFFGPAFAAATPLAWVLTAAAIPVSLKTMLSAGFKACDRGWIVGQAEIATLMLSAGALALLVPAFGLFGAAAASIVAQGGALIFMTLRAEVKLGIKARDLFVPRRADIEIILQTAAELGAAVTRRLRSAK